MRKERFYVREKKYERKLAKRDDNKKREPNVVAGRGWFGSVLGLHGEGGGDRLAKGWPTEGP